MCKALLLNFLQTLVSSRLLSRSARSAKILEYEAMGSKMSWLREGTQNSLHLFSSASRSKDIVSRKHVIHAMKLNLNIWCIGRIYPASRIIRLIRIREFRHDVYGRRQTAKMTSEFVFISSNS